MVLEICLRSPSDAEKLNKEACKVDTPLWVHSDNGRIMVDARSLLGLYACVGMPSRLVAEDSFDPEVVYKVADKAGVISG